MVLQNLFLSVASWVSDSFPIIRIVMIVLMVAIGIAIILLVLFSPSESSGMGALTGQSDTFYSKNKSKTVESAIKRATIVLGVLEAVLSILFFVSLVIYSGAV